MLLVVLNWVYAIVVSFIVGYAILHIIEKRFHYEIRKANSYIWAGLIALTVYAQWFSLFYKVGLLANLLLVLSCAAIVVIWRKDMAVVLQRIRSTLRWKGCLAIAVLFLVFAYGTSRGTMIYDTALYHGQSIRWLEEYGVVKGLGLLHARFAYNSASFALSALFSMAFAGIQSLHAMSGLFAFLLSVVCLDIFRGIFNRKIQSSDIARLGALYYLSLIYKEMISPASDYFTMIIIFYIIISWLDSLEREKTERRGNMSVPYSLLCVAAVFAISLKFSAGFILLLLIKPAAMLIQRKAHREIGTYLIMGIVVIAPFLLRNVVISGWLLYPFPYIDLFTLDWKIPRAYVLGDMQEISVWAREVMDVSRYHEPITKWFSHWLTQQQRTEQLLIAGGVLASVIMPVGIIVQLVRKKWEKIDVWIVLGTLEVSFLMWLFSAPMPRYGYAYLILLPLLAAGIPVITFLRKGHIVIASFIMLFLVYRGYRTVEYMYKVAALPNYIVQEDYAKPEVEAYEVNGVTFYKPLYGDRLGYEYFPGGPYYFSNEFIGDTLKEGFRLKADRTNEE